MDESLVETIFGQVKSQGLFDEIRRECLSDVDTTPAYQNLRQRVDTEVSKFLSKQEWTPDTNKNQLREKLRKYIIEMNFLDTGVQRIVDQVVNPKVPVFMPKIEDMVYKHLGVEKPKVEVLEPPGISELSLDCNPASRPVPEEVKEEADLLPTDLEAVSPDSERSHDRKSDCSLKREREIKSEADDKMDEDISPPFEPIEMDEKISLPDALIKNESQESTISGLTSQDSIESDHSPLRLNNNNIVKAEVTPQDASPAIKAETPLKSTESPDPVKEDTQLSQLSSDTQNSLLAPERQSASNEEPLKMDISEEAQMPIEFQEPEKSANHEVLTSFDLNKEAIKFEQVKREKESPQKSPLTSNAPIPVSSEASNEVGETDSQPSLDSPVASKPPHPLPLPTLPTDESKPTQPTEETHSKPTPPRQEPQAALVNSVCPSGEVNKILVKANVAEDTEESLLDSGDSMDLKIVESDSRGSVSNSNQSAAEAKETKKPEERSHSSSHRRSHNDHHRSSSSSTSHQHRSTGSSHKSSRDRDRDKDRSSGRRRSRDHHKSDRKGDRTSSSNKKDSDRKRDKDKEKEKSSNKDSSSCRDRNEKQRRSTDRDSNDGAGNNVSSSQKSSGGTTNGTEKSSKSTTSSTGDNQKSISSTTSPRDQGSSGKSKERKGTDHSQSPTTSSAPDSSTSDRVQKPIVVDQFLDGKELNLQIMAGGTPEATPGSNSPSSSTSEVVLKKPKIAANFKEALKLSKIRKMMDLQKAKEAERAKVALNKNNAQSIEEEDDGEDSLHYFPEPETKVEESATETWWRETKEQNTNPKLIEEVKQFLNGMVDNKRRALPLSPVDKAGKEEPVAKKGKVEEKTKPINGITNRMTKLVNLVDMVDDCESDEDYQEMEVDLDDLPVGENNNVQKENKNYGLVFNKLVNGDAELELTFGAPKEEERKARVPKQPVTQTQRYTSEDLYKPRPVIGRSRRSRALDGEAEGSR